MKKFILFFAIAMLAADLSFGQFALGLKVGYNANKLSTDLDSIKSQFNSGFHVGIWARIGKRLYFSPEFKYMLSGTVFTEEGTVSTSGWKQKIKVGSIDIPLLLGFKIIHSKLITWRIEVGPEVSFVVNSKVEDMNSVLGPITTSDLSTANWYILGGTGIDFLFMSLDVRYKYGLNKMIQDAQNYTFDTKNSVILVSLGFKIIGKK